MEPQHPQEQKPLTPAAEEQWQEISPEVEKIWAAVFMTTDKILKVHLNVGFERFRTFAHPTLTNIVFALNVLETLLDTVRSSGVLELDENRMVLNAKQQILMVQLVAGALQSGNQDDYTDAIEKMRRQARF